MLTGDVKVTSISLFAHLPGTAVHAGEYWAGTAEPEAPPCHVPEASFTSPPQQPFIFIALAE
jgi:hypothetical protein